MNVKKSKKLAFSIKVDEKTIVYRSNQLTQKLREREADRFMGQRKFQVGDVNILKQNANEDLLGGIENYGLTATDPKGLIKSKYI